MSLPAGQATLPLFCQAEETAWLSSFHQPLWLSSSRRMPAPPGALPCASPAPGPAAAVGCSPRHAERWRVVPGCFLHVTFPVSTAGLGAWPWLPRVPGPRCRPSGALLQVVGSLPGASPCAPAGQAGEKSLGCSGRSPEEYQVSRPYLVAVFVIPVVPLGREAQSFLNPWAVSSGRPSSVPSLAALGTASQNYRNVPLYPP